MDNYLFNLLGRPIITYSMEPKNGKNKVTRTQINISFPLNSDFSILIRAIIGNIIALIIIDCQIKECNTKRFHQFHKILQFINNCT
jgi:hypothetical protein